MQKREPKRCGLIGAAFRSESAQKRPVNAWDLQAATSDMQELLTNG